MMDELEKIQNIKSEKCKSITSSENYIKQLKTELDDIVKKENELMAYLGENEYYLEFEKGRKHFKYIFHDKWKLKNRINKNVHIDLGLEGELKNNCRKFIENTDLDVSLYKYGHCGLVGAELRIIHKNDKLYIEDKVYYDGSYDHTDSFSIGKDNLLAILTQIVQN